MKALKLAVAGLLVVIGGLLFTIHRMNNRETRSEVAQAPAMEASPASTPAPAATPSP